MIDGQLYLHAHFSLLTFSYDCPISFPHVSCQINCNKNSLQISLTTFPRILTISPQFIFSKIYYPSETNRHTFILGIQEGSVNKTGIAKLISYQPHPLPNLHPLSLPIPHSLALQHHHRLEKM